MKIIVFILVIAVLISLLICLIALTKYLNFDRKIRKIREADPWPQSAKSTMNKASRLREFKLKQNDKDTN